MVDTVGEKEAGRRRHSRNRKGLAELGVPRIRACLDISRYEEHEALDSPLDSHPNAHTHSIFAERVLE